MKGKIMKTILVDDDIIGMQDFEVECSTLTEIEIVGKFTSPRAALEFAEKNTVEFALLDISMPELDGFELYDKLKEIRPDMIIVFVTAYPAYTVSAIKKKVDYIVYKPYDKEDIDDILARVKLLKHRLKKRIYCNTFGHFNIFVDGTPIIFKSAKAKEILALSIYRRGGLVSAEEIIDKLWPEYNGTVGECSIFRLTVKHLVDTLKQNNAESIFGRKRGICYVNKDTFGCDYYEFLNDDPEAISNFRGEFMTEYPWAEAGIFTLQERKMSKMTIHKKTAF